MWLRLAGRAHARVVLVVEADKWRETALGRDSRDCELNRDNATGAVSFDNNDN